MLRQLIGLLNSNDVTTVMCSAGVLCNLTCNNAKNKTIVCQLHGVEVREREGGREGGMDGEKESTLFRQQDMGM